MISDLVMPQLGMTMTEGTVTRWLKRAGDQVHKGEPVLEIQTDKVDMELEAPHDGYLIQIIAAEGATLLVGKPVGRIANQPDEKAPLEQDRPTEHPAEQQLETAPAAASEPPSRRFLASPRARRVAREYGVDLSNVVGTGAYGRICEADVRSYLDRQPPPAPISSSTPSSARKVIADRLTLSAGAIPQFWLCREIDATALVELRERILPVLQSSFQVRLSYTDLLLKALGLAVEAMPDMKQRWVNDRLESTPGSSIGFAAQSPTRLMAPVVRDAAKRSIGEIAVERARLTARTMEDALALTDLEGACCTLSNLGAFDVDEFQAIINPPQSCILAAGRIAPRPFVVDGALMVRQTLRLVLTVDHRVADGVAGARFLSLLAEKLQNPLSLVL